MNDDQGHRDLFVEPRNCSRRIAPVMVANHEKPELFIEPVCKASISKQPEYEEPGYDSDRHEYQGPECEDPVYGQYECGDADVLAESKPIHSWVRLALFITAMIVPLGLIYAVDQRYIHDKFLFDQIIIKDGFDSRGTERIREAALSELDGNFFSANLGKLKDQIAQISWIASVSVRRQWPSTLVVAVDPINPVVRWNDRKWINYTGEILDIPPFIEAHELAGLPVLFGTPGQELELFESYLDWSEKFAAWGLTLVSLAADDTNLWHLELSPSALSKTRNPVAGTLESPEWVKTPTRMVVNHHNARERIPRFVASLDRGLMDQFEGIASIDLRYSNGFAVRWKTEKEGTLAMRESE